MPLISVERPITYTSWELGKYTTYDICIDCSEDSCPLFALSRSCVPRRYSQFKWFRRRLSYACPYTEVPNLPTAGCFLTDRFTQQFIENRRRGLEEFIKRIYSIPTLLSEASFHLFVQTNLTTREIDGYLRRKWGRSKEVSQIIQEVNVQKFEDERDDLCSIASCSRWSDASAVSDLDDGGVDSEPEGGRPASFSGGENLHARLPRGGGDAASTSGGSSAADVTVRTTRRRRHRFCSNALRITTTSSQPPTLNFGAASSAPGVTTRGVRPAGSTGLVTPSS